MVSGKGGSNLPPVSETIDVSSPYFLTSSDHLGLNLVGENLLHDGNYSDWKDEMMNVLFTKSKMGFVGNSLPMPQEGSNDFMNWKRCNPMVRGCYVSAMEKDQSQI